MRIIDETKGDVQFLNINDSKLTFQYKFRYHFLSNVIITDK